MTIGTAQTPIVTIAKTGKRSAWNPVKIKLLSAVGAREP